MNWWFLALIVLYLINLGTHLARHNGIKISIYNFWICLFGTVIGVFLIYMAVKTGF